jgi:3-oxoacyl-[acyl-carrier-protein] synthase III
VVEMAVLAAQDCLSRAAIPASEIGMLVVSSGSAEQRFPGPASSVATRLGCGQIPAWDLPVASAGSLFGMALANSMAARYGTVLVVAAEKMSAISMRQPLDRNIAILFGDGAGACLISATHGSAAIAGEALHSDGSFAGDLCLEHGGLGHGGLGHGGALEMNGRSVILQASRKLPAGISEVLGRAGTLAADVEVFLVHQANKNLIDRVAQSLGVAADRFYSNIQHYGNTSSASMLIAAAEYFAGQPAPAGPVVFAAFGAGFHWGAILVESRGA